VGISGGVDSAVAAYLLKEQGHDVSGLFMVNWQDDEDGYCTAAEDFQAARAVCEEIGIPLERIDFSQDYRERVFQQFLADYQAGKTPNPDLLCNREVKFLPFRNHALRLGADFIATGHYADIRHDPDGAVLLRAADDNKDQTYFLAAVTRPQLDRILFPLGRFTKPEVRALALKAGLPNHQRKDSTGICFIGERPFRAFLSQYLKNQAGWIVDAQGRRLAEHAGSYLYTLGQRKGLNVGGVKGASEAPWYVVAKHGNDVVVSQQADDPRLMCHALRVENMNWLTTPPAGALLARIRHRQSLQTCEWRRLSDGTTEISFPMAQRAATAGQYCVLYHNNVCLGGGEITGVDYLSR
jgi:tRNA-specific 2-thiouridylase